MVEDERTVEPSADVADGEVEPDAVSDDASSLTGDVTVGGFATEELADDDVAEAFLELEADLEELDPDDDLHADGARVRGLVTDARRSAASELPADHPLEPGTDEVLALTVALGEAETTVYLEWPDGSGETPLRRLLDATGFELGDLYGHQLLVERTGDYYTVVTPTERPRGSGDWGLGVLGGLGLSTVALVAVLATLGSALPLTVLWFGLTFGWLPYATYRDAWYVRTHSDWDGGPLFWTTLSMFPVLNLVTVGAYLRSRSQARFFDDEPSLRTRAVRKLRAWL